MIIDVFTRLPVKSLGQCKCVSKPWYSLISDPYFTKMHLKKASSTNAVLISTKFNPGSLYSVDFTNNFKNNSNCDGIASKLNFNLSNKWSIVWGSCNGLILVESNRRSKFLLNPATLEFKKLPRFRSGYPSNSTYNYFGFGYDSSCDDYAVVVISNHCNFKKNACVFVYTLSTNQWKKVGFSPYDHKLHRPTSGTYVAGSLHWLANNVNDSSLIIASFSIADKEFSEVPLPKGIANLSFKVLRLGDFKGCLCLFTSVFNGGTECWLMKEYGVVESWMKLSFFLTEASWVVSLHLQEDSLVLLEGGQFVLLVSTAIEVTLQRMTILGLPDDSRFGMTSVDSLVSPNSKNVNK
ncbi:F-box domain-containing protein [Heracleum sosnowskyi]|uniref:F-box domain-containing protein n=1 Tax=Heracleum sosnowskyi TaxID=360622 RepID=A0AAD8HNY5_9APIA|nr:F-box domain-containing protein [Heracleum sosnowskyi]